MPRTVLESHSRSSAEGVTSAATAFYSVPALADLLEVHPKTIRRMIDRGELSTVKVGRAVRIPAAEAARLGYLPEGAA